MPLTRNFKELLRKRIARDPAFGDALAALDIAKRDHPDLPSGG